MEDNWKEFRDSITIVDNEKLKTLLNGYKQIESNRKVSYEIAQKEANRALTAYVTAEQRVAIILEEVAKREKEV